MKKTNLLLLAAFWIIAPLGLLEQAVFAGDSGSQSANWSAVTCSECDEKQSYYDAATHKWRDRCVPHPNPPPYCRAGARNSEKKRRQQQLAVAKMSGENNRTPGGGLAGGDTGARAGLSFFASILVLLGGIWTLFVLLRDRFGKNRPARAWSFALRPRAALTVFAVLFAATIVGSFITAPKKVTAEKRRKPDKAKMIGVTNPSNKPVFKSAQKIGGDSMTQIGPPVFDSAGNRYVRGGFSGNLKIGSTTLAATAAYDLFFAKYAPDGTPLWARKGSGVTQPFGIEGATAMAVDPAGNVYVGGSFAKQLTLQGGANQSVTLADAGGGGFNYESFVAKYDANGNLLWARGGNSGSPQSPGNLDVGQNAVNQIVFDQNGDPYLTGFVAGNNFLGTATAVAGQTDILIAKLDKMTGAPLWRQVIGGSEDDNGLDLKIDGGGNLYLIGNFSSPQITFPNGTMFGNSDDSNDTLSDSTNTFIAKFNSSGSNLWVKTFDNASIIGGSQIAVNSGGEIFLTGYFLDSATFGDTTLLNTGGDGDSVRDLTGYVAKMDTDGNFVWAEGFYGVGQGLALDPTGRIYIIGTFYDGGIFGADTPNEEALASFGGVDLFVARFDANGIFDWAKPIVGSGFSGAPIAAVGNTENYYFPFGVSYNPARGTMFVSGDFQIASALDCHTLTSAGEDNHQSYLAELSADNETTSCRIWNGLDEDDNNWESIDNWNGGVLPSPNDSVYVPYTGNNFDAPDFNPATDQPVANLVIADDRILTLGRDLTVGNRLDLLGGYIDADNFTISLGASAQAFSINDGRVLGKVRKQFSAATNSFTFPVGTENGYSPVTLSNISGSGSFSVIAYQGTYPNTATNLPANRAERWWNLTNGGLNKTDLTFQYVESDIIGGTEADYRAFRIPAQGGAATHVNSSINIANRTVSVPNATQFSDWTLAQIAANARTIAGTAIYGITPAGPTTKIVPSVALSAVGSGSASAATTDFDGAYQLGNLNAGGEYTVTPSKTGDVNGITPFDATLVLRCIAAGPGCQLTDNQKLAADTNNSGDITPFDATQILRFVAANGQTAATGQVGNWKFNLPFIFYNALNDSLTNENHTAILVGEVSGDWTANVSAAAEMK